MKKRLFLIPLILLFLFACSSDEIGDNTESKKVDEKVELVTLKSGAIVERQDNSYIYSGDILLSEKQLHLLDETGSMFQNLPEEGLDNIKDVGIPVDPMSGMTAYSTPSMTKAVGKSPYQNMFWSMLRFTLHKNLSASQRQSILNAMSYMESVTNVRFYNATNEPVRDPKYGFDYPYVEFTPSNVNNSYVGRIGGKQILNLFNFDRGTIVHEICHALGMFHEQCRADRDNYITVNYNNIRKDSQHNFNKETRNYYMIGDLDFNSIMLYDSYAFAIDYSKPTMTRKNGSIFYANRYSLSEMDRSFLNRFYLPYIARLDVCAQLDRVVYDGNNNPLTEAQRIDLERQLNINRCSYPLR